MVHILIINLHSSYNAGDAVLALSATRQLQEAFPGSIVTLSITEPFSHTGSDHKVGSFMYWIHPLTANRQMKWRLGEILRLGVGSMIAVISYRWRKKPKFLFLTNDQKAFLQAYFDADLVTSAPGNFLLTSGKFGFTFLTAVYSLAYALWARKPLYILPQSVGPINRKWERWLIPMIFNRARLIMVREEVSLQLLHQIKVTNPKVFLQPDLAFSYPAAPVEEAEQWLQSYNIQSGDGTPRLGMTAIDWGAHTGQTALQARYEAALAAVARYFVEHMRGKVILFPQVVDAVIEDDDRIPAQRVVESVPDLNERVRLVDQPSSPMVLKSAYGLMDIFIGTRMHSNIFALSSEVPTLAIAYRYKTQGIMHMLGLDEWVIDIQAINSDVLIERLIALWERRESVRVHIQQTLPSIIEGSRRAGQLIADDFSRI